MSLFWRNSHHRLYWKLSSWQLPITRETNLMKMTQFPFGYQIPRESDALSLQWCHNGRDSVLNHKPRECLLSRLIRRRSKKTSKLRDTGLCAGNSPETGEFPAQMASNAKNVYIWWCHHGEDLWHFKSLAHLIQSNNNDNNKNTDAHMRHMVLVSQYITLNTNFASVNVLSVKYLTHWGWVKHICVSKLTTIDWDNGLTPGSAPSHDLNKYWNVANANKVNKFQWNSFISIKDPRICFWVRRMQNGGHFVAVSVF